MGKKRKYDPLAIWHKYPTKELKGFIKKGKHSALSTREMKLVVKRRKKKRRKR